MEFFYLLNTAMFSRLFFLFRDQPLTLRKYFVMMLIQVVLLLAFRINFGLVILILLTAAINYLFFLIENRIEKLNLFRFLSFITLLIIFSVFTSGIFELEFNSGLIVFFHFLAGVSVLFKIFEEGNLHTANLVITGLLFLLNEVNLFIRYLFELFAVEPKVEEESSNEIDRKEYNAGRVIGMLERVLIFFFVLINQFAAIGFIIAAKGFTRFKELDKREFAEYVLIGTLLSSLLAMAAALLIKTLIAYY